MPAELSIATDGPVVTGHEFSVTVTASEPVDDVRLSIVRNERYRRQPEKADSITGESNTVGGSAVDVAWILWPESPEEIEDVDVVHTMELGRLEGAREVRLAVPEDASPTTTDRIAWRVRAYVETPGGPTPVDAALVVQAGRIPAAEAGRYAVDGSGDLRLEFPDGVATGRAGATLQASVVVGARKALTLTDVRVVIARVQGDPCGNQPAEVLTRITLADEVSVGAGESRRLPFTFDLPADAPTTLVTPHNWLRYHVVAYGARRWARDPEHDVQVFVTNAPV